MSSQVPRLPSRTQLFIALHGPGTLLLVAFAGFLGLGLPSGSTKLMTAGQSYLALCYGFSAIWTTAWLRSVNARARRLEVQLAAGASLSELRQRDVERLLTLYRPGFWTIFGLWYSLTLLAVPWLAWLGIPPDRTVGFGVLVGLGLGTVCAVLVYYSLYVLTSAHIAPVLLVAGSLRGLEGLSRTQTWLHIGRLILATGVGLPAIGIGMWALGTKDLLVLGYLVVLLAAITAYAVRGVVSAIARPAGHLHNQMARVRSGDLEARARIDNLDTFGQLASDFNEMVEGLRQREHLKNTFGRYVTQQIADEILGGRVTLGGERRTATVLFADIRGFTSMSERLSPEDVVRFLNEYLELMVACVLDHGGVLDKFIGDAVMAVFGTPISKGSAKLDAEAAVSCAVAMCAKLDELNQRRGTRGEPPLEIGIGLSTGELVAGNIGSPLRMEYTVIGDTVNLSSRLEGMTKQLGARIALSQTTAELVREAFPVEPRDRMEVRGRQRSEDVFVLAKRASAA